DLVTREEFEIQQALLHRANQQLAELQHRLDALEDPSGTDGRDTEQTESD
ncbi:MAG: accessory factor UbiK family protein, partial [Gammaproteobacteria bacterium]|nr:accessory factor UbiK family protein [Gammaproteobacteria bacterium]